MFNAELNNAQHNKPTHRVAAEAMSWAQFVDLLSGQAKALEGHRGNIADMVYGKILQHMQDPANAPSLAAVKASLAGASKSAQDHGYNFVGGSVGLGIKSATNGIMQRILPSPETEPNMFQMDQYVIDNFMALMNALESELDAIKVAADNFAQPSVTAIKATGQNILKTKAAEYGITDLTEPSFVTLSTKIDSIIDEKVKNVAPYVSEYPNFKGLAGVNTEISDLNNGPIAAMFKTGSTDFDTFMLGVKQIYRTWMTTDFATLNSLILTTRDVDRIKWTAANNPSAINDLFLSTSIFSNIDSIIQSLVSRSNNKLDFKAFNSGRYKWDIKNLNSLSEGQNVIVNLHYAVDGTEVTLPIELNNTNPIIKHNYLVDVMKAATESAPIVSIVSDMPISDGTDLNTLLATTHDSIVVGSKKLSEFNTEIAQALSNAGISTSASGVTTSVITEGTKRYLQFDVTDPLVNITEFDGVTEDSSLTWATGKHHKTFKVELNIRTQKEELDELIANVGDQDEVMDMTVMFRNSDNAPKVITKDIALKMFPNLARIDGLKDYEWSVYVDSFSDNDGKPEGELKISVVEKSTNAAVTLASLHFKMFKWQTKLDEYKILLESLKGNPLINHDDLPDEGETPTDDEAKAILFGWTDTVIAIKTEGVQVDMLPVTLDAEELKYLNVRLSITDAEGNVITQTAKVKIDIYLSTEQKQELLTGAKTQLDEKLDPIMEKAAAALGPNNPLFKRINQEVQGKKEQFMHDLGKILADPKFSVKDLGKIAELVKKFEKDAKEMFHKYIPTIPKDFDPKDLAKYLAAADEATTSMKIAMVGISSILGIGSLAAIGTSIKTMKFNKANKSTKRRGRGLTITSTLVGLTAASASIILMIYVFVMQGGI